MVLSGLSMATLLANRADFVPGSRRDSHAGIRAAWMLWARRAFGKGGIPPLGTLLRALEQHFSLRLSEA